MTGIRLYEYYCDATAAVFPVNRGGSDGHAELPLPAWPSLSGAARRRWNVLADIIASEVKHGSDA